jgi:hypothetical protein
MILLDRHGPLRAAVLTTTVDDAKESSSKIITWR